MEEEVRQILRAALTATAVDRVGSQISARFAALGGVGFAVTAVSVADAQIASTCLVRGLPLATRNVRDFTHLGLSLLDPWDGP